MSRNSDGQLLSNPGNDTAVMAAWERFLEGSGPPSDALRSLVERSWRRCREQDVDPGAHSAPPPVPESTLQSLKARHSELLEVSAPILACARDFLAETGTIMALADTNCSILTMEGDTRTVSAAESIHLLPGVAWSERICGTNAIGTALAVGRPVQIHSAEHFCAGIKRWTCSATVIRDPQDGEIRGVVDVSGLSESYSPQNLALVVTTANRIESRLTMRAMEHRCRLLEAALPYWSGGTDGVVLFDRRGYPVKANENAQAALAALGAELDLAKPRRIVALACEDPTAPPGEQASPALPAWMRAEWLAPVTHCGVRLGTLLIVPLPRLHRARADDAAPAGSIRRDPAHDDDAAMPGAFANIITADLGVRDAVRKAARLARSRVPVLLLGETGVGKEEFARGIHEASPFAGGPFVALNCGGLSRELLASELFGYVDGAFTGARRGGLAGKIEAANGGTLFLDEVGEMPIDLQPHLLRVLEQGEIYRLGETTPRKVDFRLIAATNRDLRQEVGSDNFRMDLYFRIAVTSIRIPPLRERRSDLRLLVAHFAERFRDKHGLLARPIAEQVFDRLAAYPWPGNIRELRNVVESMLLVSDGPAFDLDALPPELLEPGVAPGEAIDRGSDSPVRSIAEGEVEWIRRAILATGGNLTKAARKLDIAKSTLYEKIRQHGLERDIAHARGRLVE